MDLQKSFQVHTLKQKAISLTTHSMSISYGSFAEHKYEIVSRLQQRNHICGMTGDGVNDTSALKKSDIGIAVAGATDAARGASDIVLTEPGLSVIISAVLTSRAIFQRMKNYTVSQNFHKFFYTERLIQILTSSFCVDLCGFKHDTYCGKYT